MRNALAAIAVAHECGLSDRGDSAPGWRRFAGSSAGSKWWASAAGVTVYDDFAHHPTAVAETLAALRAARPGRRLWALFEPRSASSCRRIFQADFARAFGGADQVIIAPVFRSSLPEAERLSVAGSGARPRRRPASPRASCPPSTRSSTPSPKAPPAGDDVVVMSNGGFGGIHGRLLEALAR